MNLGRLVDAERRDWAGVDGFMSDVYAAAKGRGERVLHKIAYYDTAQTTIAALEPMAAAARDRLAELERKHGGLLAEYQAKTAAIDLLVTEIRLSRRPRSPENMQRERDRNRLIAEGKKLSSQLVELDKLIGPARIRADGMTRALAELRAIKLPPPDAIPGFAEWLAQKPTTRGSGTPMV